MATDWPELVAAIEVRIAAFVRDGQPEQVTESAAKELAELTWLNARDADGAVPLDAVLAVARLYWVRHQALASRLPTDESDLGAAVAIFAKIDSVAPEAVPEELRPLVDEARQQAGSGPFNDVADQVVELLAQVQTGQAPDRLEEVIQRFRQLLTELRAHEAETGDRASTATVHRATLSNLGLALHLRVERSGNSDDIAEAIQLARAALETLGENDKNSAALLGNAAMVIRSGFEYTGDPVDLDEAIALCTRAVEKLAVDHPQWPRWASNLSSLHRTRFDYTDNVDDLDQAVELATRAAELAASDVHGAALRWSNVSNGLDARYDWTRNRADLDAAIEAARRAMRLTAPTGPDRGPIVANVAGLYLTRFEHWGGLEDIDESIALAQEALGAGTLSPPKRAALLSNVANAYRFRYEHLRRSADLDHALEATREAVELTSDGDPWRASRLTNHAMALLCEFERSAQPSALSQALTAARSAVDVPDTRPSLRSMLFSNLAVVLAACAEAADDQVDRAAALDEAVESGRRAVDILPPGHPDRAIRLNNLAGTLIDRSRLGEHGPADIRAAIDFYRQAADTVTASTSVRVQAAYSQGAIAARNADWPTALDGYTSAVGLLGALVTRAITRPSREILLSRFARLAPEAAACAVGAVRTESAVALLEQSRAVLWSQALDTGTVRELRTADAPWARRLAEVAAQLE